MSYVDIIRIPQQQYILSDITDSRRRSFQQDSTNSTTPTFICTSLRTRKLCLTLDYQIAKVPARTLDAKPPMVCPPTSSLNQSEVWFRHDEWWPPLRDSLTSHNYCNESHRCPLVVFLRSSCLRITCVYETQMSTWYYTSLFVSDKNYKDCRNLRYIPYEKKGANVLCDI